MPLPTQSSIDWSNVLAVSVPCITFLIGFFKWVDAHFKSKRDERASFIEQIVDSSVKKTLDSVLGDVRADIQMLFKYREEDRKHADTRFDSVIREIKK